MSDQSLARHNMVLHQLKPNKVSDLRLLDVFNSVVREQFVPVSLQAFSYTDSDLKLGNNRFLLSPLVLARLLQMAQLKPSDKVLAIGCATGYSLAILSQLVSNVIGVESDPLLAQQAQHTLESLNITNAQIVINPLFDGCAEGSPYTIIIIEGGVATIPTALLEQLGTGGRLVTVCLSITDPAAMGQATLVTKADHTFTKKVRFETGASMLYNPNVFSNFEF